MSATGTCECIYIYIYASFDLSEVRADGPTAHKREVTFNLKTYNGIGKNYKCARLGKATKRWVHVSNPRRSYAGLISGIVSENGYGEGEERASKLTRSNGDEELILPAR